MAKAPPFTKKPTSGGTKTCPKCKAKMPASATKCPECGMPMKGK